jgi:allantoinase
MSHDLVVRARRVVITAGEVARCIGVTGGTVAAIEPLESELEGDRVVELGDDVVLLPGLVDTHVHVNEPGRSEWEGFATATRAAAAGGVTTIVDMPLNGIPPTTDVAALEVKRKAAEPQAYVDVGFWGGAIPGNLGDLRGLHDAGVFGFKCFLLHSGVDEFPHLAPAQLLEYLEVLRTYDALMIVHAEDSEAIDRAPSAHGESYRDYLASRPRGAENCSGVVWPTAPWTASSPTTPRARRSSSGSTSATSASPGAGSPRCRSVFPPSGRRPAGAASPSSTWCAGWPTAPRRSPGCSARAASRWATMPTSVSSPPTRRSWSTPPACTTATLSPRMPDGP